MTASRGVRAPCLLGNFGFSFECSFLGAAFYAPSGAGFRLLYGAKVRME